MIRRLEGLSKLLASKGFPETSPWWTATLTRFYREGLRQLALRVGRRGGKSSTLCRVAVCEALWGLHKVPPGDTGVVAIVSVNQDEAQQRLRTIKSILDAVRIKYKPIEKGLEIQRPGGIVVAFKVYAATIGGVSGFTSICVIGDELSKWKDADSGKNPATEVIASVKPTVMTQPNAKMFWSSSPLGMEDAHAKMFERKEDGVFTAQAPTWVTNPSVSEADTKKLEPDERVWRREFAAIPQGSAMGAFDPDAISFAFRDIPDAWISGTPVVAMDPAGRGSDKFVVCAAGWHRFPVNEEEKWMRDPVLSSDGTVATWIRRQDENGSFIWNDNYREVEPVISFWGFTEYDSAFRQQFSADEIARRSSLFAKSVGARKIVSDQYESFGLESLIHKNGIQFVPYTWSGTTKAQAVGRVRSWLNSRRAVFDKNEMLRKEMLAYEEKITANGLTYGGQPPGGGHFDHLSCVLTAAMADLAGDLQGGPTRRTRRRRDFGPGNFKNA